MICLSYFGALSLTWSGPYRYLNNTVADWAAFEAVGVKGTAKWATKTKWNGATNEEIYCADQ